MRIIKIDGVEYEVPTDQALALSAAIANMWDFLGRPDTPLSDQGEKLVRVIVSAWEDTDPEAVRDWKAARDEYRETELDIKDQIKQHTGRNLASYPKFVYDIMKKTFPNFDFIERENCLKMVKRYPMFRLPNKL